MKQLSRKSVICVAALCIALAILRLVSLRDHYTGPSVRSPQDIEDAHAAWSVALTYNRSRPSNESKAEVLTEYPEKFISNFKNPCWISMVERGKKLQCLPYFYLAGMPKCGTTDIWYKLMEHPGIWNCSKEPHWWGKIRVSYYVGKSKLGASAGAYYTKWGRVIDKVIKKKGIETAKKMIVGDGSASTFWENRHWRKSYPNTSLAPQSSTAYLLRKVQPEAKIIIAFRNPVDRLYSDYQYLNRNSTPTPTPQEFDRAVQFAITSFHRCLETIGDLRTCTYDTDRAVRLRLGLYSVYYEDWLQQFPPEQLLPIKTEDWSKDCPGILSRIHRFLDIDEQTFPVRRITCGAERVNVANATGVLLPETRRKLEEFYAPYNSRLATLLNDDNFVW